MSPPRLIIDAGASWSKIGFSGNLTPSFTFSTPPSHAESPAAGGMAASMDLSSPCNDATAEQGGVEEFYQQCFFSRLRVDPEDHAVVLAEPASSMPDSREALAEVRKRHVSSEIGQHAGLEGGPG